MSIGPLYSAGFEAGRKHAAAEIDRLRERCAAYKGQVESQAKLIEHLRDTVQQLSRSEEK